MPHRNKYTFDTAVTVDKLWFWTCYEFVQDGLYIAYDYTGGKLTCSNVKSQVLAKPKSCHPLERQNRSYSFNRRRLVHIHLKNVIPTPR